MNMDKYIKYKETKSSKDYVKEVRIEQLYDDIWKIDFDFESDKYEIWNYTIDDFMEGYGGDNYPETDEFELSFEDTYGDKGSIFSLKFEHNYVNHSVQIYKMIDKRSRYYLVRFIEYGGIW